MKNIIRGILVFSSLVLTWQPSLAAGQFFFLENDNIGKPASDFTLATVDGKNLSFMQFKGTDKAIIFFWATWCPHCRRELGELNQKKEELAAKGIKIAAVDIGEDLATVRTYLEKNKINMTVFLDEDSSVAQDYNLVGVPTFFFVDKQGILRDMQYSLPEKYEEIFTEPAKK